MKNPLPSFAEINRAALLRFDEVMSWLGLSGGKRQGQDREYLAKNPRRNDQHLGSFSINTTTGAWADFADDAKGGDLVSLAAYIRGEKNGEAASWLIEQLGMQTAANTAHGRYLKSPPKKPAEKSHGEFVAPVPANAPKPPGGHFRHGAPTKIWAYKTADDAAVNFYHARFDAKGAKKEFCPLTLWRDAAGRLSWHWKAPPAPRALYNLASLAKFPDAPAILCEGEKASDAAGLLLPDHPVLTWQGGAQAVSKADLSPLAGREVWIWPDNDQPGEAAARKLAELLREAGAVTIKRFNLDSLKQTPGQDGEGNLTLTPGAALENGDDAADLLDRGWTAGHVALLLQSNELVNTLAPPEAKKPNSGDSERPHFSAERFEMSEAGLFCNSQKGSFRVCPPFEILAMIRDRENGGWGLLIDLHDPDGRQHKIIVPHRFLKGDGAAALELFLDRGFVPRKGCDGFLIEYLREAKPAYRARNTHRVGWQGDAQTGVFVLPEKVYGASDDEVWHYDPIGPRANPFKTKGTLPEWREHVAALCSGNSRLLFAASVGFAAPLLHFMGMESGGFNLVGPSGAGKTTALNVGASICGGPDYLERLRATDNGLESVFLGKCDLPAFLDELGQLGPQVAGAAVYMAANGQEKARAARTGGMRERATWRTLFLLSAEVSLAQHMSEAGQAPKAGQSSRLADIRADAGAGLGVFGNLHDYASGHEFAQALKRATTSFYGTALPAFLSRLMAWRKNNMDGYLREQFRKFERANLTDKAQGQARRVCLRFALVGEAGEIAREWLDLPWQEGEAREAAARIFGEWLRDRGGEGNQEERAMLAQVRDFLSRHGEARFTDWDRPAADTEKHAPRVINRAGFRRITEESERRFIAENKAELLETEFYVFPEVWKHEVCKGFDPRAVARVLILAGHMEAGDPEHAAKAVQLPGEGRRRVYYIRPSIWAGEE